MSKVVKKIVKRVKKSFKKLKRFVKKHWKKILIAVAIVFTAGAFAVVGTGAGWGAAFSNIGATMSAGASALTGGAIGTSAASAASMTAGATTAGYTGTAMSNWVAGQGAATAATATTAATTATTMGQAMMINTGLKAYSGYQEGKAQDEAIKNRRENSSFYGMTASGRTFDKQEAPTIEAKTPNDVFNDQSEQQDPQSKQAQARPQGLVQPQQQFQPQTQQAQAQQVQAPEAQTVQYAQSPNYQPGIVQPNIPGQYQRPQNMNDLAQIEYGVS